MNNGGKIIAVAAIIGVIIAAAAKASGAVMEPRGIKNNNPGNLRPLDSGTWQGQTGVDGGGYLEFTALTYGIRAAAINLFNYAARDGVNTLQEVANRWAPSGDNNDPVAYAQTLSSVSGFSVNQGIDLTDQATNAAVLAGIFRAENGERLSGIPWVSSADIAAGQAATGKWA